MGGPAEVVPDLEYQARSVYGVQESSIQDAGTTAAQAARTLRRI